MKENNPEMRLGVFSDTHGNSRTMQEVLRDCGPFNMIVHLGDGLREGRALADQWGLPFMGVRGNEDYGEQAPMEGDVSLHGFKIVLMHGHQMEINPYQDAETWERHYGEMALKAQGRKAQAFLFGHTHKPVLKKHGGVLICNPGDQYIGSHFPPSFVELLINQETIQAAIFRRQSSGRWSECAREQRRKMETATA